MASDWRLRLRVMVQPLLQLAFPPKRFSVLSIAKIPNGAKPNRSERPADRMILPICQLGRRWVGTCRRDPLDYVIVLNKRHTKRLMNEYVRYYHDDRTHLGLDKETPAGRKIAKGTPVNAKVVSMPRLSGLHHRYDLAA